MAVDGTVRVKGMFSSGLVFRSAVSPAGPAIRA